MSNVSVTSMKIASKLTIIQPNGDTRAPNNNTITVPISISCTAGTTAAQVDRHINMQLTVTTSGTMTINLNGGTYSDGTNTGTLVDKNGTAVTLSKLKLFQISIVDEAAGPTGMYVNAAATSAVAKLGGHLSAKGNGSNSPPPGPLLWGDPSSAGVPVTSTVCVLQVVNESAAQGHVNIDIGGAH